MSNKVTMLNGMPITMLNGSDLGCTCQNKSLGELDTNAMGALAILGVCLGSAYYMHKSTSKLDGIAADIIKDSAGKIAIGAGVIGAVYFLVLKPVLQKVGVVDSKADVQAASYATSQTSPFNPQYYKGKLVTITKAAAQALAKQIYDAKSWMGDDEEKVYAAIRQMKIKNDVSWVADNFQQLYQKDMYSFIRSFMSDEEISIVHGIVNGLR